MPNLENIYLPVQRIIPFSNVEGIGNRTSIFLQGCNINCLYCHNPETIAVSSPTAHYMSLSALLEEVKKSIPFIRGITVSGGEPTIYAKELTIFFQEVHKLGLTCYIDSNGFFSYDAILPLIEETDKFLFDIKGAGEGLKKLCFSEQFLRSSMFDVTKVRLEDRIQPRLTEVYEREEAQKLSATDDNAVISRNFINLKKLLQKGKVEEVRLVYIKGFYDEVECVKQIANHLKDYPDVLFKLIRVHSKGARGPKEIAQNMPTQKDARDLVELATSLGLTKQVLIL